MISNKPYLLRAFNEWIADNGWTPILTIDTRHPHCRIPKQFLQEQEISFNISAEAVRDLKMNNDGVEFHASFGGVVNLVYVPMKAILGIYAHENEEGMYFDHEDWSDDLEPVQQHYASTVDFDKKRSHLQLVE